MKLLLHLLRSDLRRFRLFIAVWIVVVASAVAVEGLQPLAATTRALNLQTLLGGILQAAEVLMIMTLVPLVIQAHQIVGSDAFWMTRPIPPRLLLGEKLLLLSILIVAVPAIAESLLLASYQMPLAPSAGVVAERVMNQTIWLLLVAVAAALTANLPRYALVCGVALLAAAASVAVISIVALGSEDDVYAWSGEWTPPDATAPVVFGAGVIVACLALLVVQYSWRLRARSIAVGVAGVVLAALLAGLFPWDFLAPRRDVPSWAADPAQMTAAVDAASIRADRQTMVTGPDQRQEWAVVRGRLSLANVARGWSAAVSLADASLMTTGGERLSSARRAAFVTGMLLVNGMSPYDAPVMDLLDATNVGWRGGGVVPDTTAALLVLPPEEVGRVAPARGTYRGRFRIWLTRFEVVTRLPLRAGARQQSGAYAIAIRGLDRRFGQLVVAAGEAHATSIWERRWPSNRRFVLFNPARKEAIQGADYGAGTGYMPLWETFSIGGFHVGGFTVGVGSSAMSGFAIRRVNINFAIDRPAIAGVVPLAADWLRDAELVVVSETPAGSVERELEMTDFPLPPLVNLGPLR